MKDTNKKNNSGFICLIFFIITLFMELVVFNWRSIESLNYEEKQILNFNALSGVSLLNESEIRVNGYGDKCIELLNINEEVKNIYLDIRKTDNYDESKKKEGVAWNFQKFIIVISATDDGNKQYFTMPERTISQGVERTKYIKFQTTGETEKIKLEFRECDNQNLIIEKIAINKPVPYSVNILRILTVFCILFVFYAIRPGSEFYQIKYSLSYAKVWVITICMVLNIALNAVVCFTNPMFKNYDGEHHKQYDYLAQSFLNGNVYLDYAEPPQSLIDMENPYDKNEREEVMRATNSSYKWDTAYFDGKYYVYFGVLPVIVYYLPYRVLYDKPFPTYMGVFFNITIFVVFAYFIVHRLLKRWFKDVPLITYLLLSQVIISSSYIIFALRKADIYAMPITMALALVSMGLYFWLSIYEDRKKNTALKLCLGSTFMALIAACRPQFLIASFLSIPLFWNFAFKEKQLFSKKSVKNTVAFVLPYVIVAAAVMWYNYARFGSVLDFGANYNLTTNDMTSRGFRLGRIPLGVFAYLFQPPVMHGRFPFLTGVNLSNSYMGITITEFMCGGIIATQPFVWILAVLKNVRAELKQKGIYSFVITSLVFAVVVAIADAQMAGILYRYYMDLAYLIMIPAVMIALSFYEKYKNDTVLSIISFICVASLIFDAMLAFGLYDYGHEYSNPDFYYSITSAITFWL